MSINPIFDKYKFYIIAGALIALVVGEFFFVRDIYVTKHDLAIAKIERDNAIARNDVIEKLRVVEHKLETTKSELEATNAKSKEEIERLDSVHREYVRVNKLRDPGKSATPKPISCDSGTANVTTEPEDDTALSSSSSEFLLDLTKEADKLRTDYATCMDWVDTVKNLVSPPTD